MLSPELNPSYCQAFRVGSLDSASLLFSILFIIYSPSACLPPRLVAAGLNPWAPTLRSNASTHDNVLSRAIAFASSF